MLILQVVIFYKIFHDEVNTKCCTQIWKKYTCNVVKLLIKCYDLIGSMQLLIK